MFFRVYNFIFCPEAKILTPPNKVNWPKKGKKGPKKQEMPIFHQPLVLQSRITPQNVGNSRIIGGVLR